MDLSMQLFFTSAETLYSLRFPMAGEIFAKIGCTSLRAEIKSTVGIFMDLLDVASRRKLTFEAQNCVEEVKSIVDEVEDLLDKLCTLYERAWLKPSGKARLFFSRSNTQMVAHKISAGIEKIKMKLAMPSHSQVDSDFVYQPPRWRLETCSYVNSIHIVGREADKNRIVDEIFNDDRELSTIAIVGMGGLGKTALAQLVYNDEKISSAFLLKFWICVSDRGLDMKAFFCKILELSLDDERDMDWLHRRAQKHIMMERCLIVLDDVWTEHHFEWQML